MARRLSLDNIDKFHDSSIYIPTRTIYMGSEESSIEFSTESGTDAAMAERVIKNLHILESINKEPINIIMNNYGGDVNHGLAIYDAIKSCVSRVTITVFGGCMSMGSIIMQAADDRVMSPESSQMIHYGFVGVNKEAKTTYRIVAEMQRIDRWMEKLYLSKIKEKHPRFTVQKLQTMLNHDTFFTAKESVSMGLADRVLDYHE